MTIEIKHKITGKVLAKVEAETLRGADLSKADLRWANLREADLSKADLSGANLRETKGEFIFNWGVKLKVVEDDEVENE